MVFHMNLQSLQTCSLDLCSKRTHAKLGLLMLFDLKIYIREFSDSQPRNPRAPSFLGFSDVLLDETAIRFTLSDIENCQFLGFSDRTASL